MDLVFDEGIALFAGLNVPPKTKLFSLLLARYRATHE
jgi:hypothetical protein